MRSKKGWEVSGRGANLNREEAYRDHDSDELLKQRTRRNQSQIAHEKKLPTQLNELPPVHAHLVSFREEADRAAQRRWRLTASERATGDKEEASIQ